MVTLKLLDESTIAERYDFLEYKIFPGGFYLKIKAYLKNTTELYIREYSDISERNYSFHWQTKEGDLITQWDNSPHYKNIPTHPHHKHTGDRILPSYEVTLKDVLNFIRIEIKPGK